MRRELKFHAALGRGKLCPWRKNPASDAQPPPGQQAVATPREGQPVPTPLGPITENQTNSSQAVTFLYNATLYGKGAFGTIGQDGLSGSQQGGQGQPLRAPKRAHHIHIHTAPWSWEASVWKQGPSSKSSFLRAFPRHRVSFSACLQRLPQEEVLLVLEISSQDPCPAALGSHQPYLQKSASVAFITSDTHRCSFSWDPVATITRPINRAAMASLIVQLTGTWNRRSL